MKISLIGMSSSGKTYWSKKLEKEGFKRFCCDDLIEKKLNKELKSLGYSGIEAVARWMGQPFDKQYKNACKKYLKFEREVMKSLLEKLEKAKGNENIIIDTTGSIIYTGRNILEKLTHSSKVIYLHTPSFVQKQMYKEYIKNPKPVIWSDIFSRKENENNSEALKRSYESLLSSRVKKYKEISDIILDYNLLRHKSFNVKIFYDLLKNYDKK